MVRRVDVKHTVDTECQILSKQFWSGIRNIIFALLLIQFIMVFLVQPVRVEGTSMEPGLEDQERVFISKFSTKCFPINRGDIIVFNSSPVQGKSLIKRIVGLPGETISIEQGFVKINGKSLVEPYIPIEFQDDSTIQPIIVPDHCYFVMGDHRSVSNDSRHWGPIHESHILGKAVLKYWPPGDFGLVH